MELNDIQWESVPFGPEWEKEVMKLTKKDLIAILRKTCIERIEQESKGDLFKVKFYCGKHVNENAVITAIKDGIKKQTSETIEIDYDGLVTAKAYEGHDDKVKQFVLFSRNTKVLVHIAFILGAAAMEDFVLDFEFT